MSDEKSKVTDKASEIAKNIWLAGVGAYGKAVDEAQGRMERERLEPPKLFRTWSRPARPWKKRPGALEAMQRASSVEERITECGRTSTCSALPASRICEPLHKKVDQLSRKVDTLTKALAEQQAGQQTGSQKEAGRRKKPAAQAAAPEKKPRKTRPYPQGRTGLPTA